MIYINLLHYVYILFLNKWLILHVHCKLLVDLWDYNQVFEREKYLVLVLAMIPGCIYVKDFVCCIPQMKRQFRAHFHQLTTIPTNIDAQSLWGICFHVQLISKQTTQPYICAGFGYFACQLSRAMLFKWGLANRKSPVRPAIAMPASVWGILLIGNSMLPVNYPIKTMSNSMDNDCV